tara:strand:+ start:67408 stop:67572 length:165 start_codon:yes stop_codon:yes gene_type:complete
MLSGILSFIWFLILVFVIIDIISSEATTGAKVLWCVLVFFFPLIGAILWFLLGK